MARSAVFVVLLAWVAGGERIRWPEREECGAAFVANHSASSPPRIAVVLRGESFRNVGGQHMRGTCCALSVRHQRLIWDSHQRLFARLGADGYAVDAFSATRPCTSRASTVRNATDALRAWYGATLKGWAEDAVDGDPFSQLRNRWSAVKLARDYARKKKLRYAFVLVLRWDYVVHADKWDPGCVLDGALRDARDLAPREHDADKMFAIPGKFVPCFFASIVEDHVVLGPDPRGANYSKRILRPPRCQWDACVEAMARAPRLSLPRARARRRARAGPRRGPGPPRDRALRRALDEQVRAQASGRRRPRARACRVDRAPRPQVPRTRPTPTSARSRRARPRTTAPRTTGATATPTGRTGTAASRLRTGRPPPPPPRRRPAARARA